MIITEAQGLGTFAEMVASANIAVSHMVWPVGDPLQPIGSAPSDKSCLQILLSHLRRGKLGIHQPDLAFGAPHSGMDQVAVFLVTQIPPPSRQARCYVIWPSGQLSMTASTR